MKKAIVFLLMASAVLLSWNACKKSEGFSQAAVDESQAAPVLFGSNLQSSISTRTVLESWSGEEDLYIYGLRRVNDKYVLPTSADPYAESDPNAYLIRNVKAQSPDSGRHGAIKVYRNPSTREYFYYRESPYYYNFYGYYVADAAGTNPTPVERTDTIALRVAIDGTQDIMLAHTSRSADASGTGVDVSRVYGAYAARHGVTPNLVFEHELSCFDFKLKAGNEMTASDVTVQSLKVFSKTVGSLVIASNDTIAIPRGIYPSATQTPVALTVPDASGALTEAGTSFGSIMVMPGAAVYQVELKVKQTGYSLNGGIVTQNMDIDFSKIKPSPSSGQSVDTHGESGHKYEVVITVYGLEKVQIEVTMSSWDDQHGYFEIDPDENE